MACRRSKETSAGGAARSRKFAATSLRRRSSRWNATACSHMPTDARVRLGAVGYLNARPLVWGLDAFPDLFDVRCGGPARCATLLHEGFPDIGMIPSIEFLRAPEPYRIVPDLGIISEGDVGSGALFTRGPLRGAR